MQTRRQFLQATIGASAVVSLGTAAPRFLLQAAAAEPDSSGDSVLVVVQLSGGNDGLNTVAPIGDDRYYSMRPTLAVARNEALKIDKHQAFHPALQGFADLLEAGQLSVVQNVGYPNPNRSHFESMDIWHSCYRKNERTRDGWLGRFLDASLKPQQRDVPGLHLGGEQQPLALVGQKVQVPSVRSLDEFRLRLGERQALKQVIERLATTRRQADNELLGFLSANTEAALSASRRVEEANKEYKASVTYPQSGLSEKLRTVAQLIDAGLSTRIYYVTLDGFDTHSQQGGAHAGLLRQLGDAVQAFMGDLKDKGHLQRVALLCFSEFGRRVQENASEGTDHGAAAPVFVAGGGVQSGVVGQHPDLQKLDDGDIQFKIDFRQVYATVLDKWLGWDSAPVLGGSYEQLDLFV